jgi:hypothetical protein
LNLDYCVAELTLNESARFKQFVVCIASKEPTGAEATGFYQRAQKCTFDKRNVIKIAILKVRIVKAGRFKNHIVEAIVGETGGRKGATHKARVANRRIFPVATHKFASIH